MQAYATTNHIEYLAEITEAYQLKSYDPDGYNLVKLIFGLAESPSLPNNSHQMTSILSCLVLIQVFISIYI